MKPFGTIGAIINAWTGSVAAAIIAGFDRMVSPRVVRLIEDDSGGFAVETPARPVSKPGRRLRAQDLATKAIEKIIDPSAPAEERAQRQRRLLKGPEEFREARVDRPKAKGK